MAAEPPRPTRAPPRNALFRGSPPVLPQVLLLPTDGHLPPLPPGDDDSSPALDQINNVGVPIEEKVVKRQCEDRTLEKGWPPRPITNDFPGCVRRTRSFDSSDLYYYTRCSDYSVDNNVSIRRSEPDLSKYDLFVEGEVTMDSEILQPPPLVLNNPFYDGSLALELEQPNQAMVLLPENYLAFENAFVPSWEIPYTSEVFINGCMNSMPYYYNETPFIPTNPWASCSASNLPYNYYAPSLDHYSENPNNVQYIPSSDLEVPQYMNLPLLEQAEVENLTKDTTDCKEVQPIEEKSTCVLVNNLQNSDNKAGSLIIPETFVVTTPNITEDQTDTTLNVLNRKSFTPSDESFNADISNDVTSSLAFLPVSQISQLAGCSDDTSDNTSPCSTDYHEASALDLAQSLDELSCCDSTDYSQSRDEASPFLIEENKVTAVSASSQIVQPEPVNFSDTNSKKDNNSVLINDFPGVLHNAQSLNQVPTTPPGPLLTNQVPTLSKDQTSTSVDPVSINQISTSSHKLGSDNHISTSPFKPEAIKQVPVLPHTSLSGIQEPTSPLESVTTNELSISSYEAVSNNQESTSPLEFMSIKRISVSPSQQKSEESKQSVIKFDKESLHLESASAEVTNSQTTCLTTISKETNKPNESDILSSTTHHAEESSVKSETVKEKQVSLAQFKGAYPPLRPPDVPPAWLVKDRVNNNNQVTNLTIPVPQPPKILIQDDNKHTSNSEIQAKSSASSREEPLPSCSYNVPQTTRPLSAALTPAATAALLKPEPKETRLGISAAGLPPPFVRARSAVSHTPAVRLHSADFPFAPNFTRHVRTWFIGMR